MATKPPIFKPKNTGSLIPKKRKLVKTMMLEYVVDSIATLLPNCCGEHRPIKGGGGAEPPKPTADKNEKKIFPLQPWYVSLSICSCNLWSTHCSMVGWDQVCIFQFSASFSRLLYVLFFVVWMIPIELWFLCMIPSLVYEALKLFENQPMFWKQNFKMKIYEMLLWSYDMLSVFKITVRQWPGLKILF